jgi:TP901 family phage tail tape measure protein
MAGMSAFYFPLRQVQLGITEIYNLDKAMIDLKKVTDETTESYRDFGMEANQMANSIGSTTVDIIKATTEFSRLGYEMNQAKTMAQQAMVFANVGDTDFESATKSLISTMKGFNIEADASGKNIEKIVDLYNEIGNSFAISTSGVGEAMRRSSASLKAAGNTIEESVALVVAANSAIQDPVKVGTAWKTVSMRIRGISEEGEDLSHLIPTLEKSFDKLGLSLKKNDNTFKSTYEIMQDLSSVWDKMSDFQQADILEKIAGKRQGNIIAAAIKNFSDAQKAVEVGLNSQGSSAKELENFLDGIEAKLNKFKNSGVAFWQTALNSEGLKDVLELGTSLIKLLTSMVDRFGLLAPVVGTASIAIIALNTSMRTNAMSAGMKMGQTLKYVTSSMYALATGTASTNKALLANTIAVRGVTMSLHGLKAVATSTMAFLGGAILPLAGMMALGFAIEKLVSAHMKAGQEAKKVEAEEKKLLDTWTQQESKIRSLIDRHEALNRATKDGAKFKNNEQEQEYLDIQNELGSLLPSLVKSVDENGQSHLRSSKAISQEVDMLEELVRLKKEEKFLNSQQDFVDSKSQIEKLIQERDEINKTLEEGTKKVLSSSSSTNFGMDWENVLLTDEDINKFRQNANRLQIEINKLNEELANDNFLINVEFALDDRELGQEAKKAVLDLAQTMDLASLEPEEYSKTLKSVAEAFSLVESNANPKFLIEYANATGVSYDWLLKLKESLVNASDEMDGLTNSTEKQLKTMKELIDTYSNISSEVSTLNKLLRDVADGKKLSAVEAMELIAKEDELAEAISIENGIVKVNTELVQEMRDKKISAYTDPLNAEIKSVEVQSKTLLKRLDMYQTEGEALEQLAQAKLALLEMESEDVIGSMIISDARNEVNNVTKHLEKLNKLKTLAVEGLGGVGVDNSSTSSSSTPSKSTYNPYETDTFAQDMDDLDTQIDQLQSRLSLLDQTTEEYRQGQHELIGLYKEKQALTKNQADDLRKENELIKDRLKTEKLTVEERDKLQKQYDENKKNINSLAREWWNYESAAVGANKAITASFDEVNKQLEELESQRKEFADNMINLLKESIRKEKELRVSAKREELKDIEEVHSKRMESLDDELDKYEDIISTKLKALDRETDEQDYNKQLTEEQTKLQETQNKINIAELDDSIEGQARLAELKKEYAEQEKRIEELQSKRSKELRKQNLQDNLDAYRKDTEAKKNAEQEKYDATRAKIEQEIADLEWKYEEWLANERYFQNKREEIIREGYAGVEKELQGFLDRFKKYNEDVVRDIGSSWQELQNIISGIESAPTSNGSGNGINQAKKNDWNTYLGNKKRAEDTYESKGYWPEDLRNANDSLRKKWGFPDGSYDALKDYPMTFHRGGVIGGSTNRIGKMIHEMFNLKPNEQIGKLLNGEVVVNPMRIPQPTIPSIQPKTLTSQSSKTIHIEKLMHVDKIEKDVDVDRLMDQVNHKFKGLGFVLT